MNAILLLSFGGPEAPDEVMPFLRRVVGGRGIPEERLAVVAEHYVARGGRSPINGENRRLLADLRAELDRRGDDRPVLWGNRNSAPWLTDALHEAADLGVTDLTVVVTSAYRSYSSCRQYREDLAAAVEETGVDVRITKVAPYATSPGFVEAATDLLVGTVRPILANGRAPRVVFVTHSVPVTMDETSGPGDGEGWAYSRDHADVARRVLTGAGERLGAHLDGEIAYCSRSGPPQQPWLEPDVNVRLGELAADGVTDVVLHPIGFVSDHMEVVHDLDAEALSTARAVGIDAVRVPTVGRHPAFVRQLVDLALATAEPCAAGCCPNLRAARPALCGRD